MKKIIFLLLTLALVLSLSACADKSSNSNENSNGSGDSNINSPNNGDNNDGKTKLSGTITTASSFSDGVAFVNVNSDRAKTYCIDKDGYILFELDKELSTSVEIYEKFVNGYALVDGGICDKTGKIVYPAEVGVTKFYSFALDCGYIVVEKETSTFDSSKKEMGVMNTSFQWVLNLSEELYEAVSEDLWLSDTINSSSCCVGDYLYFSGCEKFVNINTGAVQENMPASLYSASLTYADQTYVDGNGSVVIDLTEYETLISGTSFINGKAVLQFYNSDANKHYFTFIDKTGAFAFEPVEIKYNTIGRTFFDGEYFMIQDQPYGSQLDIICYNSTGAVTGEIDTATLGYMSFTCDLKEGVIVIRGGYNYTTKAYYFKPSFTPLF